MIQSDKSQSDCVIVVHGGCGTIPKNYMTPDLEKECRDELRNALLRGYEILASGGSAVDAVVAAATILEDCEHFNAGKGSVFSASGQIECDSGIKDGATGTTGAVSCVKRTKNPVRAAQEVMNGTRHSLLCGTAADEFAAKRGLAVVDQNYFYSDKRWKQYQTWLGPDVHELINGNILIKRAVIDHDIATALNEEPKALHDHDDTRGTIGVVAKDALGRLASASSTGGLTGRMDGRTSDSSVCGAGFFADENVAVSGSGNGDLFIKEVACHKVAALVKYANRTLEEACREVVFELLKADHAALIGVDKCGNVSMTFNTEGFYRGCMSGPDDIVVKIWEY